MDLISYVWQEYTGLVEIFITYLEFFFVEMMYASTSNLITVSMLAAKTSPPFC